MSTAIEIFQFSIPLQISDWQRYVWALERSFHAHSERDLFFVFIYWANFCITFLRLKVAHNNVSIKHPKIKSAVKTVQQEWIEVSCNKTGMLSQAAQELDWRDMGWIQSCCSLGDVVATPPVEWHCRWWRASATGPTPPFSPGLLSCRSKLGRQRSLQ